jgi:lipopolysaccharide/colanic/teichoic acid biosynthesis glycosyltransferase
MTAKRLADILLALVLAGPALAVLALLSAGALVAHGRPVFYIAERMRDPARTFRLVKLRTMETSPTGEQRVLGGDQRSRVTPYGGWLRRTRLDELPQLWNVLRGDMSLVGPRPPLRAMVEAAPEAYASVLTNRPGVTGLATVIVCGREERLLADCRSAHETDEVYRRRCLPLKLRIDRLYGRKAGLRLDVYVLYLTLARIVRLPGRRAGRLWADARRRPKVGTIVAPPAPVPVDALPNAIPDAIPNAIPNVVQGLVSVAAPQLSRNARLK